MTVIAAIHDPKARRTWIGCDSWISVTRDFGAPWAFKKWHVEGPWAIGVSGPTLLQNVVEADSGEVFYSGRVPREKPLEVSFALRDCVHAHGWRSKDDGAPAYDFNAILASRDGCWMVGADFSVDAIPPDEFFAYGAGMDSALGAAHLAKSTGLDHEATLKAALEAACAVHRACSAPIWTRCLT